MVTTIASSTHTVVTAGTTDDEVLGTQVVTVTLGDEVLARSMVT